MPTLYTVSELKSHANAVVQHIQETNGEVYLTLNGKAAAVMISPERWEAIQQTLSMLRLLNLRSGETELFDFDQVLDEAEAELDEHGK